MMDKMMMNSKIAPFSKSSSESRAAMPRELEKSPNEAGTKGFVSDLAQAQAAAQALAQAAPQAAPQMPVAETPAALQAGKGVKPEAGSLAGHAFLAQNPAAASSMNAGSAFAGLKPWSREWVFAGDDHLDADLKAQTMAAEAGRLTQLPQNAAGAQALAGASGKAAAQAPGIQAQGAGATRGDAAALLAMSGLGPRDSLPALRAGMAGAQLQGSPLAGGAHADEAEGLEKSHGGSSAAARPESLEAQLSALHGTLEGTSGTAEARHALQGQHGMSASLSGGEFLSTLGAVRGGQGQTQANLGGGSGEREGLGGGMNSRASLRLIDGGAKEAKEKKDQFGNSLLAASGLGAHSAIQGAGLGAVPAAEVTGHVVQGAGARERLSSESLAGLTGSMRNLTPQGGGEIRVRLKPDNLGELHVRVVANGNNVGLQIQASDERSKRILEESIGHLKESMASQSLTLASVDLSVAHGKSGAAAGDSQQQHSQQGSHAFQQHDLTGQGSGQGGFGGRSGQWAGEDSSPRFGGAAPAARAAGHGASLAAGASRAGARAAAGRLDVTA